MSYRVDLRVSQYVTVGGDVVKVDVVTSFRFKIWDDVNNFLGYLVEGSEKSVTVTIEREEGDE